jgi:uncharacterized membrane protein (TIGR02234 family)
MTALRTEEEHQGMAGVSSPRDGRGKRELAAVLTAGAAGAGVVLLATRQVIAKVIVLAPRPLPASTTPLTGQDLHPAVAALAVAALASLAAVLATRGLLRRITGLITAALGIGIGLLAAGQVTAAQALDAVRTAGHAPASGSGAGSAAGSVTAGAGQGGAGGDGLSLSGVPVHVDLGGQGWRLLIIAGALLLIANGAVIMLRARRLAVMSARYDRPGRQPSGELAPGPRPAEPAGDQRAARARSGAGMWESLSAGEDPTDWPD